MKASRAAARLVPLRWRVMNPGVAGAGILLAAVGCMGGIDEASLVPDRTGDETRAGTGAGARPGASDRSGTPGGGETGGPAAASCALPPARIWKLTPRQYDASLRALFTGAAPALERLEDLLPLDKRKFQNEADHRDMPQSYVAELVEHAEQIAAMVAEAPAGIAPCLAQVGVADQACASRVFQTLLERAYRRPPSSAELTAMVEYARDRAKIDGTKRALADAITAILTSPSFLYRTELGAPGDQAQTVALDPHEQASALSYFLLDGPPDEGLRAAAASGKLADLAGVAAQVQRLLATPSAATGFLRFFAEYTQATVVTEVGKDAKLFPKFNAGLAADMETEVTAFGSSDFKHGSSETAHVAAGRFRTRRSTPSNRTGVAPFGDTESAN